jgi:DNA-binding transcriptional LysR family regulator
MEIAIARPLDPPFDHGLRVALLYRHPVVVVVPPQPSSGGPTHLSIDALVYEQFVLCDRQMTPAFFDGIVGLCCAAGFSPNIVDTSSRAKASPWFLRALAISGRPASLSPAGFSEPLYGPCRRVES